MQPCSREMQGMAAMASCMNGSSSQIPLQQLQNGQQQQQQQIQNPNLQHFDQSSSHDDFFDQMMLSTLPSWTDLATANPKTLWDLANQTNPNSGSRGGGAVSNGQKIFAVPQPGKPEDQRSLAGGLNYSASYDDSALLASRLRQHQISGGGSSPSGKQMLLQLNHHHGQPQQQQQVMVPGMARSTTSGDLGLVPLPLSLGSGDSPDSGLLVDRSRDDIDGGSFKSPNPSEGDGLFNGFGGSLQRAANQQHFHHTQPSQAYGAPAPVMGQAPASGGGASSGTAPPRQRVRARRGQATDPHSIAERLRRERIAERMKALQELVPNANKTDKASMLDEIIDYVKFLQLQVKVLSMSRLGGAAAVAPLVADISHAAGAMMGRGNVSSQSASGSDSLTVTEQQVAKLMEEDMGSAMQYLQGKGLCLMPISLASAISTATGSHSRTAGTGMAIPNTNGGGGNSLLPASNNGEEPSSPSMSVLTVQSAMINGAEADVSRPLVKDAASVTKP